MLAKTESEVINMTTESCSGGSPWKGRVDIVSAALELDRNGVQVAGVSEENVLRGVRALRAAQRTGREEQIIAILNGVSTTTNQA